MQRRGLMLLTGGLAAPRIAHAAWPVDRPIEIVIPAVAGADLDLMGRLVAHHLPLQLAGARCVVVNRPGAGGQVGFETLFNAPPDGHTIGAVNNTALHVLSIERRTRYQPEEFTPIANVVDDPGGFWVRPNSPLNTLADIQQAARGRPGEIGVGTAGIGSDDHMLILAFEAVAEITLLHVPYAATPPIQRDLLVGTLPIGAFNGSESLALLRSGRIRGIAQAGPDRWAATAAIPTFRESGFDVLGGSARGIAAPPGLPAEITLQFELAFADMLASPDFVREAEMQSLPLRPLIGDAYRRRMAADYAALQARWERRPWRE
ncbi:MAG: Tripartite-type tricarboxylate transporter, receptor component TctC [Rubritepida sp.]|nr:Tripartite-type tricarboxylate transporter, receptor component TctC [Rubritepida sp.]